MISYHTTDKLTVSSPLSSLGGPHNDEDGTIAQQGACRDLRVSKSYVKTLAAKDGDGQKLWRSMGLALLNVMLQPGSFEAHQLLDRTGDVSRRHCPPQDFPRRHEVRELECEDQVPPAGWPQSCSLQMQGVTAKYNISNAQSQPALCDINLDLLPRQNIID